MKEEDFLQLRGIPFASQWFIQL